MTQNLRTYSSLVASFMQSDLDAFGVSTARSRTLIADNGAEISIGELIRTGGRPMVWSLDDRGRMLARPLIDVTAAAQKEVFTVRFSSGRMMEATGSTGFLAISGWIALSALKIDDRLATPRRVPEPLHTRSLADDEIVLLAHMIGDDSCVRNHPIRYASIDEMNLSAVAIAAKHFGVMAKRDDYPAARVTTLRLPAPYHLTHGKRNPIAAWLDGMGLFGKRSYEKFVPTAIFAAPNDQVALFLRHLWATDGNVDTIPREVWDSVRQGLTKK